MKRICLLTIMIFSCSLIFAQNAYTVGQYVIVHNGDQQNEYTNIKGNYLLLKLDSEGNGVCEFHWGENGYDSFSGKDFNYVYVKSTQRSDVPKNEHEALMDFYYSTDGPHWKRNDGWGKDLPVEKWYGVYVPKSRVEGISLSDNGLTGTIPQSFKNLSALQYFFVNKNNLRGTLPIGMYNLSKLTDLDISSNNFSGDFPEHPFSELMNQLHGGSFRFYDNNFTLPLPEWVKNNDNFWEYWPDFIWQKAYEWDWNSTFGDLKLPGPKYILTDMDGHSHLYSNDYANNKLTILYKWASWCPFSEILTPKLVSAYDKYKNNGLKIIGIVDFYNDKSENVGRYIYDHGIKWPNIVDKYYFNTPWDYNNQQYNEKNNAVIPMRLFGNVPKIFAINNQGELVLESYYHDYNEIIPLIEEMFGPIETSYYTSTDYSRDGEVIKLQTATEGNGIDIVFLGEAFVDKDMETGGKYEQKMREAMEQFFAVEPYTSLRNRFNVYTVKAVSPNAEFAEDAVHAINEEDSKAFDYAKKALGDNPNRMMVGVIYNSDYNVDRSYNKMYMDDGSFVSYIFGGISLIINHEMGGHGFAQLLDEYVDKGNETLSLPEENKLYLDEIWQKYGAGANVDWHSSTSDVKWAKFINDPRYADEKLGVFEGSYLYGYGAYRPTEKSLMRSDDEPFNAPSREAIYKNIMKYSESNWTYNFEDFVAFDKANSGTSRTNNNNQSRRHEATNLYKHHKNSTIIIGDWRKAFSKAVSDK